VRSRVQQFTSPKASWKLRFPTLAAGEASANGSAASNATSEIRFIVEDANPIT
jgi:hypothetical protein